MTNNKYLQALIIALAGTAMSFVPVAGQCLGCLTVIGLFLYISKLQANGNPDYSVKTGIQFGLVYAGIAVLTSLVSKMLFVDLMKRQAIQGMESVMNFLPEEAKDQMYIEIDKIDSMGTMDFVFGDLVTVIAVSAAMGVIFGLVAGLIFKKDDEEN